MYIITRSTKQQRKFRMTWLGACCFSRYSWRGRTIVAVVQQHSASSAHTALKKRWFTPGRPYNRFSLKQAAITVRAGGVSNAYYIRIAHLFRRSLPVESIPDECGGSLFFLFVARAGDRRSAQETRRRLHARLGGDRPHSQGKNHQHTGETKKEEEIPTYVSKI